MAGAEKQHDFLSESWITSANDIMKLDPPIITAFLEAAAMVRGSAQLRELAISCRDLVLAAGEDDYKTMVAELLSVLKDRNDDLKVGMGRHAGMFAALLVPLLLPRTIHRYRSYGISNDVLVDTMSDIGIWIKSYYDQHGIWGLDNIRWLLNHLCCRLFRLGRLQFIREPFRHSVIVLRNVRDGEVAALSEAGVDYRKDGLVDGTNRIFDSLDKWTARFERTDGYFIGNPLLSAGKALNQPAYLPATDWRIELQRGDPVLSIHIPEGGKMAHELCKESMLLAVDFYRKHFPDRPFRAFACTSWLMDPQFQTILPDSSNIVKFQKEFYLFPIRSNEEETYRRVFGAAEVDPATAGRDTGLRRAILDHAAAGNRPHAASGFLLQDDLTSGMKRHF
jgi:hypothetical protein